MIIAQKCLYTPRGSRIRQRTLWFESVERDTRERDLRLFKSLCETQTFMKTHFVGDSDEQKCRLRSLQKPNDFQMSLAKARLHARKTIQQRGKRSHEFPAENFLKQGKGEFRARA